MFQQMSGMSAYYREPMRRPPSLGGFGFTSTNQKLFQFTGSAMSLQTRIDGLTQQNIDKIVDINIMVTGIEIHKGNRCLEFVTFVPGFYLIIPNFFHCCDWFRKKIVDIYDIPMVIYDSIAILMKSKNLRNMTLTVVDNLFNEQKARILYGMVAGSTLRGLTFINMAKNFDYRGKQYSDFENNIRPIKEIRKIRSDIRWQPAVNPGYMDNGF